MRAAVYHGREDVRVESVPEPGPVGPAEVRLEIIRSALCGTDAGEYRYGPMMVPLFTRHPASGHEGPTIIGHEMVGRVAEAGAAVASISVGDRVVPGAGMWCGECSWCMAGRTNLCAGYYTLGLNADGGMAELVNVPARMCQLVPEQCTDDAAAMAQPLAVALHAVNRAQVTAGELVVLIGVGGIGFFVLAGLVARGARVIVLDVDQARLDGARQFGAAHTIDVRGEDVEDQVEAAAQQAPVGVVIEASGASGSPALAQRIMARGGRLLIVGIQKAPRELDLADLVLREIDVATTLAHVCNHDLPESLQILSGSELASGALDRVVPLEAVVEEGLVPLADGRVFGKVLVDPGSTR
jgi:(R,R)-butanediol dehydrogenase/meso-butanediol dehydrogenase/diacetyl reductase